MILVVIPYHKAKRYSLNHVLDWIENQTYKDIEVIMKWHTGEYGEKGIIKKQFNHFRDIFLAGDYTHMYIMEADTIPPLDALHKLVNADKDIISGTYYYRDNAKNLVAWELESSFHNVVKVLGTGTGTLLLSFKVLKAIDWTYDQIDADYPFMEKAIKHGFQPYLHKDVNCKHYINEESYA